MKATAHNTESTSAKAGVFVALAGAFRRHEGGRSSSGSLARPYVARAGARCAIACLVVIGLLASVTDAAWATEGTGPPQAIIKFYGVRATRTMLETQVQPEGSNTSWALEISASSSAGPWSVLENGTVKPTGFSGGDVVHKLYRHLTPGTAYYLRVVAMNALGTTTQTTIKDLSKPGESPISSFTTPSAGQPEVFAVGPNLDPIEPGSFDGRYCEHIHPTSVECEAHIETEGGGETKYDFEYATLEGGPFNPFTLNPSGSISLAEDFAEPKATVSGLKPETTYHLRIQAENAKGTTLATEAFETGPAKPTQLHVSLEAVTDNATATSVHLDGVLIPNNFETKYRFEYSTEPESASSWKAVPGGAGTIAAVDATQEYRRATVNFTGLHPGTTYYVRLSAENEPEPGLIKTAVSPFEGFETAGPPSASTFAVHTFHGGTVRALGSVGQNGAPLEEEQTLTIGGGATGGSFTLSFEGEVTAPISFIHHEVETVGQGGRIERALQALPSIAKSGGVVVSENFATNTYTIQFTDGLAGQALPQLVADGSGLTPAGATATLATLQSGAPFDAKYNIEYVDQEHFEAPGPEGGFAAATVEPAIDIGAANVFREEVKGHTVLGFSRALVGADLPRLTPGRAYHYRFTATNTAPGNPLVRGNEQVLTVPSAGAAVEPACANEALRAGPSERLPDCRAYEQVTPAEKAGAQDIYSYAGLVTEQTALGADGEHVMFDAPGVQWGLNPDPTRSTYVLSRAERGWQTTSVRPRSTPEALSYGEPALWSPDLTQVAFDRVGWSTGGGNGSSTVELLSGPPGGPYASTARIPRPAGGNAEQQGFVAASTDLSTTIIQTADHHLLGHSTGTVENYDLYESSGGSLRQVNVQSDGSRISTCGAVVPSADRGAGPGGNAVSADGSHVFFTDNCTHHLYMRVGGTQTVDIGEYTFLAADANGTKALLRREVAGHEELFLYQTGTKTLTSLPGARQGHVSADLSTIYFSRSESLTPEAPAESNSGGENFYRYDITTKTMRFLFQFTPEASTFTEYEVSPDGRDLYFTAAVVGGERQPGGTQTFRYDDTQSVVQCISCVSPTNPEPKSPSFFDQGDGTVARPIAASDSGDYVFFDTAAALVPQDVDGEAKPEPIQGENPDLRYSVSSDVYEWRKTDVDGCAHVQGCLSLITSGQGGRKNVLLGTDASGRDVFFATHESLVPGDVDTAGDIYDARLGGGFAPPAPRPVECEGDACSTAFSAPNDLTPSSATFQGSGNVAGTAVTKTKPEPKKHTKKKPKRHGTPKKKAKRAGKHARKASHDRRASR